MATEAGPRLDLLVFGATGFTGKYTVEEVIKLAKESGSLSWGISGRNQAKLKGLLTEISKKTGEDLGNIPIVLADIKDEDSLTKMAARACVVINCAGPYRFFGEAVVKACIASGTHHVDVSGEPQYMERMQYEYHKAAEEKHVYVVSACGFDSIPADLGTVFLSNKFGGDLNSVETYLESWTKGGVKGGIHYGTWESAVYGLAYANELRSLRQKLHPSRLPAFFPQLKRRAVIHKSEHVQGWCLPFPGSDRSVVMRSQRHFYEKDKQRPIQMQAYVAFRSLLAVLAMSLFSGLFVIFTKFKFGRTLMLKLLVDLYRPKLITSFGTGLSDDTEFPRIFSFGFVSHEGPSEQSMKNTHFALTLCGEGWKEKLAEPTDHHSSPTNKKVVVKVTGTNPGYGATCTALVLSAIMVLKESDKMPGRGGVYPPGAAFAKTSLIEELDKHDLKFEMISCKEE